MNSKDSQKVPIKNHSYKALSKTKRLTWKEQKNNV